MRPIARIAILILMGISVSSCQKIGDDLAGPAASLTAPANLTGTARAAGTEVVLAWEDRSLSETNFRVDIDWDAAFTSPIHRVEILPANTTSYVCPTLPATTYYFRVLAVTSTLESDPSNIFSITTPNPPPTPSGLRATTISTSRIDLSWFDGTTETGYRLERSTDGGSTWTVAATLPANTTATSDQGLASDTEYRYRLYATNADGDSLPATVTAMTVSAYVTLTTVSSLGTVGMYTSIALAGGLRYITHYDPTNTDCLLTRGPLSPPSTPWVTWTIDAGPTNAQTVGSNGTSIAADATGFVYIAAQDSTNGDLRFITNNPGPQYVATSLDTTGNFGARPKVVVSPVDGTVHILYIDNLAGADQIKHAARSTVGLWSFESILPSPYYIASFSAAFESNGHLHVSVSRSPDAGIYELVHGEKVGSTWSYTSITSAGQPWDNSIAVDALGFPHIAYCALHPVTSVLRLMHATNAGGSWALEAVDESEGRSVGYYNSIAIHPTTGRIHIAYYESTDGDLRYARKDPGGAWVRLVLDAMGNVGAYTSIAVDVNDVVNIAYLDESNQDLKLAVGAP